MTLFIIAFLAGILTVLAPCVLPLLPVIVGGSLTDGKVHIRRAFTVTVSLGVSVIAFTFILKVSTLFVDIPQSVWSWVSATILFVFGLITLFPKLWDRFTSKTPFLNRLNRSSNQLLGAGYQRQSFWGDVIVGASLGPVFSTCSPTYFVILATVLPASLLVGFIDLLAYTVGLCSALLVVALVGQKILDRLGVAADPEGWFKRTLGVIFIVVAVAIASGSDKVIEARILASGFFDITRVEQYLLQSGTDTSSTDTVSTSTAPSTSTVASSSSTTTIPTTDTKKISKLPLLSGAEKAFKYEKVAEITRPSGFVNTGGQPISIGQFKGKKVVLIDFWTYSCINCQRTIPYLVEWDRKYRDQGLEIIGIHTPEFSFEKKLSNVEDAIAGFGIKYPVVLDNDYATWNAFFNTFWPRKYIVDVDGYIVYNHIGEGEYDVTEKAIQKALAELHARSGDVKDGRDGITPMPFGISKPADVIAIDEQKVGSPETYFGSNRNAYLGNGLMGKDGQQSLTIPQPITGVSSALSKNILYLGGIWNFDSEFAQNLGEASIVYRYDSKNVYMVASADTAVAPDGVEVEIYIDGVKTQTMTIKDEKLYTIVSGADYGEHVLEIRIKKAGLKAFTFTFG